MKKYRGEMDDFVDINKVVDQEDEAEYHRSDNDDDSEGDNSLLATKLSIWAVIAAIISVVDLITTYLFMYFTFWRPTKKGMFILNNIFFESTELGRLSHHIMMVMIWINPFLGFLAFRKQYKLHKDHLLVKNQHPSRSKLVAASIIYVIFVWELKILSAQKVIFKFLQV